MRGPGLPGRLERRDGRPGPALAERWEVENPTTWVFHLRRDVRWHDGSPFTSADVIATLERVQDHPLGRQKHRLRNVASFEAPDDYTVKIVTRQPNAPAAGRDVHPGDRLTSKAQLERGDDLATVAPLGTGPYRFKEWVQDQRVVIAKVSDWWGGPVQGPDEVVYRLMRESQARIAGLLNGEIQIAQDIPYQDAERLSNQPNLRLVPAESLTLMFLGMNQAFPPWDNKLLRQAVAYAIDRAAIIQSVLLGYATLLDGAVGPGHFGYDPAISASLPLRPRAGPPARRPGRSSQRRRRGADRARGHLPQGQGGGGGDRADADRRGDPNEGRDARKLHALGQRPGGQGGVFLPGARLAAGPGQLQ